MTSVDFDAEAPPLVGVAMHHELNASWQELVPTVIGPAEATAPPRCHVCYVTAAHAGRIAVYVDADAATFREEAISVGTTIFVGAGERVAVMDTETRVVLEHRLDCYFASLHALPDGVLVASGKSLWRVGRDGVVRWRCVNLGVDGVVISRVEDGVVHGDVELDPPGGWVPFHVDLGTGQRLR